jgi:DNA repair photolyase
MELNPILFNKNFKKRKGRIMIPSSHDLTPKFKNETLIVIEKLLKSNNHLLITSKPHLSIIHSIIDKFSNFRNQIQFRFTITSSINENLRFWEPFAPDFEERLECLKYAHKNYFKTSVSIEPFLDNELINLIKTIDPFVTESIWIGLMNYIDLNVDRSLQNKYDSIRNLYNNSNLLKIYNSLKNNVKIRWKDSFRKKISIITEKKTKHQ